MLPYHNAMLIHSIGKITLPYFYGTSKCIVNSLIQKFHTYFQLDPMTERDSIKMESLYLDGEANDWWFHGMKNFQLVVSWHQVVTYEEFTRDWQKCLIREILISLSENWHMSNKLELLNPTYLNSKD